MSDASGPRSGKAADYYRSDRSGFLDWVGGEHGRVLDIGCGSGTNASWYRRHGAQEIVGVEIDDISARQASAVFDRVVNSAVEAAFEELDGVFDLIVCADVLEHLVDPWSVASQFRRLAVESTVLAISMPNIRFFPALARIAVGSGFRYEERGIFDSTHLRFFTRGNMEDLIIGAGWQSKRWGAPTFGRFGSLRRLAQQATHGRSDEWLAGQLYVAAGIDDLHGPTGPS